MSTLSPTDDLVEVNVLYIANDEERVRVEDADGNKLWLPKSEISDGWEGEHVDQFDMLTLTIPQWLAVDRGLV